jgi:EAL domain-containing protein (putative c-di-GMP-specific phosphodiesterase class I)/ActR/RegA family two-component response regulator
MPCSNLRFLVVEDHEFQRQMLVQLLNSLGAQAVHSAEDGHAALQVIRDPDRPVDIVVSDLSMPGMDGMEFIRHLSEAGAKMSLILASALEPKLLASVANMARAYKVQLLGAIGKPLSAAKLAPLIKCHRSGGPGSEDDEAAYSLDEIADAWTQNDFAPCFEPKVDLTTGKVRGMHASPWWSHPVQGLLQAETFMPSIQARGLNDDFVWLMVQKSAAQCKRWQSKGLELVVSVNLPFDSLTDVNLAARIKQIVEKENLEPRYMVLGVTEAALNTELAKALENLARLRMDGFGLAIDDFGSGQMAMEQLSLVAFTELKIRSSFVADAHSNDSARAGLAVSLELAHQLKLKTVADGIQSKEEWQLLREWGCDLGQGPFISGALQEEAVFAWLAQRKGATIQ